MKKLRMDGWIDRWRMGGWIMIMKNRWMNEWMMCLHSLAILLGTPCYRVGLPFALRTALILLRKFLRDFGPYWPDGITQLLQSCRLHIHDVNDPKGALLDWDLVTVEAIWVKWTHCHVQETSLRWFELCDMVHYPAGSSIRRWTQVGCGV